MGVERGAPAPPAPRVDSREYGGGVGWGDCEKTGETVRGRSRGVGRGAWGVGDGSPPLPFRRGGVSGWESGSGDGYARIERIPGAETQGCGILREPVYPGRPPPGPLCRRSLTDGPRERSGGGETPPQCCGGVEGRVTGGAVLHPVEGEVFGPWRPHRQRDEVGGRPQGTPSVDNLQFLCSQSPRGITANNHGRVVDLPFTTLVSELRSALSTKARLQSMRAFPKANGTPIPPLPPGGGVTDCCRSASSLIVAGWCPPLRSSAPTQSLPQSGPPLGFRSGAAPVV